MKSGLHLGHVQIVSLEADTAHPNKMKFRGVLVRLDEASTKPPNGSQGHCILVPSHVAKRRLKTLIGMGLNYSPDLDTHAQRRKVGVIDKAWIDGKDLRVEGHIWKHDFPEAEKDLKQSGLGMSMELGDVKVDNTNADVWRLDDFQFLGATILWRNSAAYNKTQAIAARAEQRRDGMKNSGTTTRKKARVLPEQRLAKIAADAAAEAVRKGTKRVLSVLESQTAQLASIAASQEELDGRIGTIEVQRSSGSSEDGATINADGKSTTTTSSEEEMDSHAVKARKSKAPASSTSSSEDGCDDEMDSVRQSSSSSTASSEDGDGEDDEFESAVDTGDLKEDEESDGNAGHANEDAENRGNDGAEDMVKKVGKTVESSKVRALRTQNKQLRQRLAAARADTVKLEKRMTKKMDTLRSQVEAAAKRTERRSLAPEITAMLSKAGIEASDMFRSGTKMTVSEVDGIFASCGVAMKPEDRMALKNKFLAAGLMEDGRVVRN